MKTSKKQIKNYTKVAGYLNMRSFDSCTRYVQESMTKVDAKLKRLHLEFDATLALADEKLKQEKKEKQIVEREQKKRAKKIDKQKAAALAFKKQNNHGFARTIEFARPYCFNTYDFISGSYRENTGAGSYDVSLRIHKAFDVYTDTNKDWDTYAKSCGFPCINYDTLIFLPKNGYFGLVGGLWTWVSKLDRKGSKAAWIEQRKGVQCIAVRGFLVNGYHVSDAESKTVEQARAYVLAVRLKQRAKELRLTKKTFTLQDSLNAGNCKAGSLAFANAHEIDPYGTYTGKFLLDIATAGEMPFVKRFVK